MKNWASRNKWIILGVLLGAIGGFFYWQQIGCNTGTCMITSRWPNSTLYGAVMGGLLFSIFTSNRKKAKTPPDIS